MPVLYLADKVFILLLCSAYLLGREISAAEICALLLSVTVSFAGQVLSEKSGEKEKNKSANRRRLFKCFLEAGCCVLCAFLPEFIVFFPLVVYEIMRTRDYPVMFLGGAVLIFAAAANGMAAVYPILICLLAVFFCMKTLKLEETDVQNKKSRDDSAELEKIMRLRNRELEENLQYEIHINTLRERNRIAREIHDNVGHLLSRSLLQTGALSAVCPKEAAALKNGLEELKDSLNSAMNSIRESVHGIRDDSLDLKNEAERIIQPLRADFSVEFDFDISGEMPPKIKLCFISILKEAASNIIRHSSGDRVSVILREHPSMYQLIIYDNGKAESTQSTDGMGLSNMEERARAIGGNFRINKEKGFTVFVSVRKEGL